MRQSEKFQRGQNIDQQKVNLTNRDEKTDVVFKNIEEERQDFYEREFKKRTKMDDGQMREHLEKESNQRQDYNDTLISKTTTDSRLKLMRLIGNNILIRCFQKPIASLNGRYIPDVVKQEVPDGRGGKQNVMVPNDFPYIPVAVVALMSPNLLRPEVELGFNVGDIITLNPNSNFHQLPFFMNKSQLNINKFEGYFMISPNAIESIVAVELLPFIINNESPDLRKSDL